MKRRSPWRIVIVVVLLLVAVGIALIATTRNQTGPREIGIALATGGVTGLVFLFVQALIQAEGERQQLLLHLSTTQDLEGLNLRHRSLDGLTLVGKRLPVADLSEASLKDCRFVGVDLRWSSLRRTDFTGTTFAYANLEDTDLRDSTLRRVDMRRARVVNSRLGGAKLTEADLTGADFSKAELLECEIGQIFYDDTTMWPTGFRPPAPDPTVLDIHVGKPNWHDYWTRHGFTNAAARLGANFRPSDI
jgi:hypothetical protein